MHQATLCFLVKEEDILLGFKKRGFGAGRWNGFGGKVKENETIEQAVIRETEEENGAIVDPKHLRKVAEIDFYFTNAPPGKDWDQTVHIYLADIWTGTIKEKEEMRPKWFNKPEIPYSEMWKDDAYWLPQILAGKRIKGKVIFGEDNSNILSYEFNEVQELYF